MSAGTHTPTPPQPPPPPNPHTPGPVIRCGGEHPPDFTDLGEALCGAPALAWEGRQGAAAAVGGRGTTVPLSPTHSHGGGGGLAQGLGIRLFAFGGAIGLSPLLILTLCGPERGLVVSTEPPDDLSCWTTRVVDQVHPDAPSESMREFAEGGGVGRTFGVGSLAFRFGRHNPGAKSRGFPSPCALHAPCRMPSSVLPPKFAQPNGPGTNSPPPPPSENTLRRLLGLAGFPSTPPRPQNSLCVIAVVHGPCAHCTASRGVRIEANVWMGGRVEGCLRRDGASEAAPDAVRQAVGGVFQSGWGRLLSVTNAIGAGTCGRGGSGRAQAGRPEGGGVTSPLPMHPCHCHPVPPTAVPLLSLPEGCGRVSGGFWRACGVCVACPTGAQGHALPVLNKCGSLILISLSLEFR